MLHLIRESCDITHQWKIHIERQPTDTKHWLTHCPEAGPFQLKQTAPQTKAELGEKQLSHQEHLLLQRACSRVLFPHDS